MRVVHIIPGISRRSGGPSRSVQGMVASLARVGVDTWLLTCYGDELPWFDGIANFIRREGESETPPSVNRFLMENLQRLRPDIVHIHALWMWCSHLAMKASYKLGIPYVISPRGMLDPWAFHHKWWKKLPAWWLYQRRDLVHAAAFCVTAEMEADHVRQFGFRQPIIVSPNGVHVPTVLPEKTETNPKTALFLARLHPGKGLLTLAEVWGRIRPAGWKMRVVGPDQYGHKAAVVARIKALGLEADWEFVEELDDEAKWQELRRASLFVFPSVSENFGISIAEALYAELPVVATQGTPWQELVTHQCGWWIEQGEQALEKALLEAFNQKAVDRREMGRRGGALIRQKYLWGSVGENLKDWYQQLLT